jgi:general secretion pathway protein D
MRLFHYSRCRSARASFLAVAVCGIVLVQVLPGLAHGQSAGGRPAQQVDDARSARVASGNEVTLNFRDADIDSVIGAFGHLLDRTFIIDPRVRGKITLETPRPVTREQAYRLLQSQLRSQGFAIVDTGTLTKVVPEADAKLQASQVTAGRAPSETGEQIVTQIFRLNYESATNLVPVLRPLISPNNTVVAYPNNNALVVTDYAANLQRIARIIATLDSPMTDGIEVVAVQHAVASDIASAVSRMLEDTGRATAGAQIDAGQRLTVLAEPRSNSVILRTGSPAKLSLAKTLIARLDQPSSQPGNIYVVYLRNAEAVKLAQTLSGVLAAGFGAQADGRPGSQTATSALAAARQQPNVANQTGAGQGQTAATTPLQQSQTQPVTVQAGGATIAADPSTNSLIITAPEPIYRNLRAVIDRLDARRAQVFIESLIVEVSAERAAELGVQWQFLGTPQGSTRVIGGTNLSARGTGGNILDAAANLGSIGQGLNFGVADGTVTLPGVGEVVNLAFLARALESKASANILATPNLLTLDNEEARIIIGQNVPFITGQFTATGTGGASVNPFQTIERRDVGTTLRVKPQVSESGTVRLQIFQEVSSVQSVALQAGIVTNRRAIESNVLVDDGQIVVLGGLIEEKIEGNEQKVPGLGDVPYIGQMFRYDNRKRVKTNLLVFLRPIIVRDGESAYALSADRYEYIRGVRATPTLREHWLLPNEKPADLPTPPQPPSREQPPPVGRPDDSGAQAAPPPSRRASGPASLSPEVDESVRRDPAPIYRSRPVLVIPPPLGNEVFVPLGGASQGGGSPARPVKPSRTSDEAAGRAPGSAD